MIDTLMSETQKNRINEMTEQLFAEIEGLVDTMTGEHAKTTYTKGELLMMYVNATASNLQTQALMKVRAERNMQAISREL